MTRSRHHRVLRTIPALLALAAVGVSCLKLPETAPAPRRWVLSTGSEAVAVERFTRRLGVGPIELPGYLDRPEVIERLGPHEVRVVDGNVWGESLVLGIQRVIAEEMTRRVPGLAVVDFPWKGPVDLDYRLAVVITRFEHDAPSKSVVLEARWVLRDEVRGEIIASRAQSLRTPLEDEGMPGAMDAMSRALAELTDTIAAELEGASASEPEGES